MTQKLLGNMKVCKLLQNKKVFKLLENMPAIRMYKLLGNIMIQIIRKYDKHIQIIKVFDTKC